MRTRHRAVLAAAVLGLTGCGGGRVEAATATQAMSVDTLHAIQDFVIEVEGYAPFYREDNRDGYPSLAINSVLYEGEYAAADHVWRGPTGTFDVSIGIRSEFDGEPTYILLLDGTPQRLTVAPRTEIPIGAPTPHTWRGVRISSGQTIRVVANNATNGLLPEGDGTGYARGRWSYLVLTRME